MNLKLVSIIIPIYNMEKYLERCINSIVAQTYSRIEILLINDGSSDGSEEICNYYKKNDNRVKYYKIPNGGVSNARNFGLKKSKGDFITFIDADDYISNGYIEKMMLAQQKDDYDIVMCNGQDFDDNGFINNKYEIANNVMLNREDSIVHFFKSDLFTPVCWGRLYKKDLIKDIKFDKTMRIAEDGKFLITAIENSNRNIIINEKLYFYYIRQNSAVHSAFNEKFYDEVDFCDELIKKYEDNPTIEQLAIDKKMHYIFRCLMMDGINKKQKKSFIKEYNILYKNLKIHKIKTIVKKAIVNNFFLFNIIKNIK